MAINNYECMFILDSGRFAANPNKATNQLMKLFERAKAEVVAHRPWQDGKLAYPVEGHRKGLHYLVYFRMDGSQVTEFRRLCKLNDLILRHLLLKHPPELFQLMVDALEGKVRKPEPAEEEEESPEVDSVEDEEEEEAVEVD